MNDDSGFAQLLRARIPQFLLHQNHQRMKESADALDFTTDLAPQLDVDIRVALLRYAL